MKAYGIDDKYEVMGIKNGTRAIYGVWNNDMQALQYIPAWGKTTTKHVKDATNMAKTLNQMHHEKEKI